MNIRETITSAGVADLSGVGVDAADGSAAAERLTGATGSADDAAELLGAARVVQDAEIARVRELFKEIQDGVSADELQQFALSFRYEDPLYSEYPADLMMEFASRVCLMIDRDRLPELETFAATVRDALWSNSRFGDAAMREFFTRSKV